MGLFYTNITLYGPNQKQIADSIKQLKRVAFISPTIKQFTVIYDKETEDQNTNLLQYLAKTLSKTFECKALAALVHDSDIFMYWLYDNGKLLDIYDSIPGYFDSTAEKSLPKGGNAMKLCSAFDMPYAVERVAKIFQKVKATNLADDWSVENLQGEDIHTELAEALGFPAFSAKIGYYTLENGEFPEGLNQTNLIK